MNKKALIVKIVEELMSKAATFANAARMARAEATHEESKAEDRYDTRGLEASYLAAGQSRHVSETEQALIDFQTLRVHAFKPKDPIDVGAVVELELKGEETNWYFIGPSAGGTEVEHEGKTILVLTPQSPLGGKLVGRKQGDGMRIRIGGHLNEYHVASVV